MKALFMSPWRAKPQKPIYESKKKLRQRKSRIPRLTTKTPNPEPSRESRRVPV